jgi:hypothetical protein
MSLATVLHELVVSAINYQPDVWLNTDYKTIDSVAKPGDLQLPLREIYHKI